MIDYASLYRRLERTRLASQVPTIRESVESAWRERRHGDMDDWLAAVDTLPNLPAMKPWLTESAITVGDEKSVCEAERAALSTGLQALHPWRKGPFSLHGVEIDAEWRSDRKWSRIQQAVTPLDDRTILDVGCGNGYYAWRMLGDGAGLVMGIDPTWRFVCQYEAVRRYVGDLPAYVLPLALEDLPESVRGFDTVFSMGVFYHRRSPFEHLYRLKSLLRPGGELVLETLVIDGGEGQVLVPPDRYAQMRNVWFLPSVPTLVAWLKRAGFHDVKVADVTATTPDEQRRTDWMRFHSLSDFLDSENPKLTVEGLPAPVRAILVAEAPS